MSDINPNTIQLSKPIRAHGEDLTELTLRKPTTKDVREIGFPYSVSTSGNIVFDAAVVAQYIVRLGAIPMKSVDSLEVVDFQTAQALVQGFFGRSAESGTEEADQSQIGS